MMLWKCYTQYASKLGKFSSGHRTGQGQFSFQSHRMAMPKNVQTATQFHSSHSSRKTVLKSLQARLQPYMNCELTGVQVGFRKGRGTRDQIANICLDHQKSMKIPEKHLFLLYWLHQSLWHCGSQQTVENSSRDEKTRPPDLPPETSVYGQEATVRTGHGITDWFQIGKGVCQCCILSPYLFNL